MLEKQESSQEINTRRDLNQTNVSRQGQCAKGDVINNGDNNYNEAIVQGSDAGETVVNNGGTQTNIGDSIDQRGSVNVANNILCLETDLLLNAITEGGLALADLQSLKSFFSSSLSKIPIHSDSREQVKKLIENSELDSIAVRLKSYAVLAGYLEEQERRTWLGEFMAYGCYEQLVEFSPINNLPTTRQKLAACLCYCLKWLQYYFSYLKPGIIPAEVQGKLKVYPRRIFDKAFAVLEDHIKKESGLSNSELYELQQCIQEFYKEISLD